VNLSEISIVRHGLSDMQVGTYGAVKGAEITRCFALEPKPAQAPRSSAAVVSSGRSAAGEVIPIRRAARRRPTTFPRSEFERRMDFAINLAENFGIHGAVEAEIEHMQRLEQALQLGRVPPVLGVR
jgi:hypothetical protein